MKRSGRDNNKGFTFAELMLLLAVIAVFLLIAIPIVNDKLEEAREIADMAQARSVYGLVTTESMLTKIDSSTVYYYDGSTLTTTRPETGYGESSRPFESFAPKGFPVEVTGVPRRDGEPMFLMVKMDKKGTGGIDKMIWGGYPVVTTKDSYKKMSTQQKMAEDRELLNTLQATVQNMKYKQLKKIFWDSGRDRYRDKYYPEEGFEGGMTFSIALSNIDNASGEVIYTTMHSGKYEGHKRNEILARKVLERIGYNVELTKPSQYLILSHDYYQDSKTTDPLVIKLSLPEDLETAKDKEKAKGAVVFLDGNGIDGETDTVFGYYARKDALKYE